SPGTGTKLCVSLPLIDQIGAARRREQAAQLEATLERARQAITFSTTAARIAVLFLLFGAPFVAGGPGLPAAAGGVLRARLARAHLALNLGSNGDTDVPLLRLRHEELAVLPTLLLLGGLSAWYLPVAAHAVWPVQIAWLTAVALWLLCLVLA